MGTGTRSPAILVKGLTKNFGDSKALRGVNLEIAHGECIGILGPNGAGKTTLLNILTCQMGSYEGEVFVENLNVKKNCAEVKRRIGIVAQEDGLDSDLSVIENLIVFAHYFGISEKTSFLKASEILRNVQLIDYADKPVDTLSGGMKRRLALARGLMNDPTILFLDEPTTGLDPQMRQWIWTYLQHLKSLGKTLILTTHYMEEAEFLCDRVAIMDQGMVLEDAAPELLIQQRIGAEVIEFYLEPRDVGYYVARLKQAGCVFEVYNSRISVFLPPGANPKDVLNLVSAHRTTIRKAGLSDVFLKVAGHDLQREVGVRHV